MSLTRRQWFQAATLWPACLGLQAARREFWDNVDPASWTKDEKLFLLSQSPWVRDGFVRVELESNRKESHDYGMPQVKAGLPPGAVQSVPIGEPVPPVPDPDPNHPVQFRVLARWESAKPVLLAGGPEMPELPGPFYVIRLRGLPLMPPPKAKPGEAASNPNEHLLQAIKGGSRLERKDKPAIPCARLFAGPENEATEVLLFFPRGANPITMSDKLVTLESHFAQFHLSIKFPLKDMTYKGQLAL